MLTKQELEEIRARYEAGTSPLDQAVNAYMDTVQKLINAQDAEIAKLREDLRRAERYVCKLTASGQGRDGKWHEEKVCQICQAVIKTPGQGHKKHCAFYVTEDKHD